GGPGQPHCRVRCDFRTDVVDDESHLHTIALMPPASGKAPPAEPRYIRRAGVVPLRCACRRGPASAIAASLRHPACESPEVAKAKTCRPAIARRDDLPAGMRAAA